MLRVTWPQVLRYALHPGQRRWLGHRQDADAGIGFDGRGAELAIEGLQAVALRLPATTPLSQVQYDAEARVIERESRRWRTTDPVRMPRSVFILGQFNGDWEAALREAGLEERCRVLLAVGASRANAKRETRRAHVSAAPVHETLERALEELGDLPNRVYFERWCRDRRLLLPLRRSWQWNDALDALRSSRAARGLETPERARRASNLPPLRADVMRPRLCRRRGMSRADALADLRRYAERYLAAGALPRQKDYMRASSADPQLHAWNTMQQFGGFQELCREAGIA